MPVYPTGKAVRQLRNDIARSSLDPDGSSRQGSRGRCDWTRSSS